jgi:hypothetical protein
MIEAMEPRRLMAFPVVAVGMNGTAGQITGVVLTFNVDLDPTSAQNPRAYSVSKRVAGDSDSPTNTDGTTRRVRFVSAAYDPAGRTVTLTPGEPFDLGRKFRRLRIEGSGGNAIKEASGAAIDGDGDGRPGGNAFFFSRVVRAGGFTFREADGDRGRLRLHGPGSLRVWSDKKRIAAPVVFLVGTDAGRSTLSGSVLQNRRRGDGVVALHQVSGTASASVPLLNDAGFRVQVVTP